MVGVVGTDDLPATRAVGAPAVAAAAAAAAALASAPQPGSPRSSLSAVQLQQGPKHRLAQSSFHVEEEKEEVRLRAKANYSGLPY